MTEISKKLNSHGDFLRVEPARAKTSYPIGRIGHAIQVVAQKATVGYLFISYFCDLHTWAIQKMLSNPCKNFSANSQPRIPIVFNKVPCTYHDYNYDYEKYLQIILSLVGNCLLSVLASNLLRVIRRLKLTAICFEPLLRVNMKAYGKNSENTFLFGIFLFLKNLLCRRSCINGGL